MGKRIATQADDGQAGLAVSTAVVTLATCAVVAAHGLVFGSVEGRWVFPYIQPYRASAAMAGVAAAGAAVLLVAAALRVRRSYPAAAVALAVAGATVLQLLLWRIYPHSPGSIVRSDNATSYFSAALRYDPLVLLRFYDRIAPTLPLHAVGNMPGKILLFRAFHALTASPDVMAVLVLLLSNLVGVVLIGVAREFLDDPEASFGALVLWLFIPARLVFAPILNGVVPLPVVLALLAWLRFLRTERAWLAVATGLALLVALLLDPTPLGLGLLFVAAAFLSPPNRREGVARAIQVARGGTIAAGALVGGWLALRSATGFDVLAHLARVAGEADRFNAWAGRGYAAWLLPNVVEFLVCLGVPVLVAIIWGLSRPGARTRPAARLAGVALATLLVLDLLGRNRGEVARLWIFATVPFVLAAAGFLAGRRAALLHATAWMVVQGATLLAVLGFVIP